MTAGEEIEIVYYITTSLLPQIVLVVLIPALLLGITIQFLREELL
jgi:hypothetical protein